MGTVLQVGAYIIPDSDEIVEVTATNLSTGVTLELTDLSAIFDFYYEAWPDPIFDPEQHLGVWEITATDASGEMVSKTTQELHLVEPFPYVRAVKAEGSDLAQLISWKPPKDHKVPSECFLLYEVRLMTDVYNQFYVSPLLLGTWIQIPD